MRVIRVAAVMLQCHGSGHSLLYLVYDKQVRAGLAGIYVTDGGLGSGTVTADQKLL